jgi:hypothetical protein
MAGEASALGLGLFFWRWSRTRERLKKKVPPARRKIFGYLGAALLALLGLQVAYCAWGIAAWIG